MRRGPAHLRKDPQKVTEAQWQARPGRRAKVAQRRTQPWRRAKEARSRSAKRVSEIGALGAGADVPFSDSGGEDVVGLSVRDFEESMSGGGSCRWWPLASTGTERAMADDDGME
ncbi:hypothetical protein DPEC_G00303080 [Dallia pectoralis]|uniref:Uncharacterized protein n=1 Tax=Dallia pectoralis TaxID=75939 RepID=A0ACC2FH78_DALPE|nr:hypothetical protein DPEC_G00303080 [Dallia pectoralis]